MDSASHDEQFAALAPHYDELMDTVPYAFWAEYVETLWKFVEYEPRRVLDCACGTGNVSFELAERGYDVTGVDISPGMIDIAQRKAQHSPHTIRFVRADLTDFDLKTKFEAASCLYDSLNYILDPAALQAAFERIAAHLEPGGIFVFDMNSVYALSSDLFTQRSYNPRKALHYDWQADFDKSTRVCSVTMKFRRKNENGEIQVFHETHRERAYTREEVVSMLEATGWTLLHSFDAYTLNRPHRQSERWFFVARRD